jgi:hypothetical protein
MCLNITGQHESDGEKLNRSSMNIVVSENPGWYHVAIALETRDVKKKQLWVVVGEETISGVAKTPSNVVVSNILLIFKNETTRFVTSKCLNVFETYNFVTWLKVGRPSMYHYLNKVIKIAATTSND